MSVAVPQEILDMVIDYLHDDFQMLKTCSFLSKSCLASTRHHLFSSLHFTNCADFDCVARWISSPHISTLVRHISVGRGVRSAMMFCPRYLPSFDTGSCDKPLGWSSLAHIVTSFPNLTSLKVDNVKFDSPLDAFRLVAGFPLLRQLQWNNVRFEKHGFDVAHNVFPPPFLRDLYLTCCDGQKDVEQFIAWLTSHATRIHLKVLAIGWSVDLTLLIPFLTPWGRTLSILDLSGVTARIEDFHIGSMTTLREIRLPFVHLRSEHHIKNSYGWVYHLLSSISSSHIHTISVPLELYYELFDDADCPSSNGEENMMDFLEESMHHQLEWIDWRQIDKLVVGIRSWSSLSRVVVLMKLVDSDFDVASRTMYRLLPNCISSGVVVETRLWSTNA